MGINKITNIRIYFIVICFLGILFVGYGVFNSYLIVNQSKENNEVLVKTIESLRNEHNLNLNVDTLKSRQIGYKDIEELLIQQSITRLTSYSDNLAETASSNNNTLILWATVLTLLSIMFTFLGLVELKDRLKKVDIAKEKLNEISESNREESKLATYRFDFMTISQEKELLLSLNRIDVLIHAVNSDKSLKLESKEGILEQIYSHKGQLLYSLKYYREALNAYNNVISLNPNNLGVLINRGNTFSELELYDSAISDYNKIIELNTGFALAYYNRGKVFSKKKMFPEAIEDYETTIKLNPDFYKAYNNLAFIYRKQNQLDLALDYCNRVIWRNSSFVDSFINRAHIYHDRNQLDLALADYEMIIQLDSGYKKAYNSLCVVYGKLGQYDLALKNANKLIGLDPNFVDAYVNRGLIYAEMAQFDLAIKDYNKVEEIGKPSIPMHFNRGSLYIKMQEDELASKDFNYILVNDPSDTYKLHKQIQEYLKAINSRRKKD